MLPFVSSTVKLAPLIVVTPVKAPAISIFLIPARLRVVVHVLVVLSQCPKDTCSSALVEAL